VTQKISQNENVKLGSLQNSTTPTLLDKLQQCLRSISETDEYWFAVFEVIHTDRGETSVFVHFGQQSYYVQDLNIPTPANVVGQTFHPFDIVYWGSYFFLFYGGINTHLVDSQFRPDERAKLSISTDTARPRVLTNCEHLFYLSGEGTLICVSKDLVETVVFPNDEVLVSCLFLYTRAAVMLETSTLSIWIGEIRRVNW
jgi:hypothetical protein